MLKKNLCLIISLFSAWLYAQVPLFKQLQEQDGLLSNKIYDIKNYNGLLWIASDKGVSSFDGKRFSHYFLQNGLPENEIIKLQIDGQNKLWAIGASSRLSYFVKEKFEPLASNESLLKFLNNRIISSIGSDNNGDILVTTILGGGTFRIKNNLKVEVVKDDWTSGASFFIKQLSRNHYIWGSNNVSAFNKKLRVYLQNKIQEINLTASQGYSKASFIQLMSGEYLYAKDQELIHFNDSVIIGRSFLEKNIECVYEDAEGKIWVGLNTGGAVCFPMGIISAGGYFSYFGNKTITSICEDNKGNLWLSSLESGIYYLPSNPYSSYAPPKVFSSKSEIKNQRSNIKSSVTYDTLKINTNLSSDLIPKYYSDTIKKNTNFDTIAPLIYISGIKINEKDTLPGNYYSLSHNENSIKINYAAFSVINTQKFQFRYRLSDIDKDWIYTDNTFVQYNALPPGDYLFSVSAMNANGVWSKESASVFFKILPPFWQTTWFLVLSISIIAFIIFLFFIIRIKQIKKREEEKTKLHKRIADIELQALQAQMNPHFIFNTLASIQYFITDNNVEAANQYLSKFAKLMRSIIYNSRRKKVPLKDEIQALELYIQMEQLRCNYSFDYKIICSNNVDLNDDEVPGLLIQPYVENAIWHGLMYVKDRKGELNILIDKNDNLLKCVIDDNGIGRKKSMEIKAQSLKPHQSVGMSITKERLDILNTIQNHKLSVNIIDKINKQTLEPEGTQVEIYIPLAD
ncbi:MAG: histidine kinase [Bacteroidia bacterium]